MGNITNKQKYGRCMEVRLIFCVYFKKNLATTVQHFREMAGVSKVVPVSPIGDLYCPTG